MNNPAAAFITIMEIELRDLEDDIQLIMAQSEMRRHHEEISNYVYMENLALMKKELFDVDGLIHKLRELDPAEFASDREVKDLLLRDLRIKVQHQLIPPVILKMVERKFDKVSRYVCQRENCD